MRTLIISDCHGINPCKNFNDFKEFNKLVFLGDYDNPKILEDILSLEIEKTVLIGNHDYHLALNYSMPEEEKVYLKSDFLPDFEEEKEKYNQLEEERQKHEKARKFIEDSAKFQLGNRAGLEIVQMLNNEKVVFTHGFLLVDNSRPHYQLGGRLFGKFGAKHDFAIEGNFKIMREQNYWILFRGHDHIPFVLNTDRVIKNSKIALEPTNKVCFKKDKLYIVTSGCFALNGEYSILDEEKMELSMF